MLECFTGFRVQNDKLASSKTRNLFRTFSLLFDDLLLQKATVFLFGKKFSEKVAVLFVFLQTR